MASSCFERHGMSVVYADKNSAMFNTLIYFALLIFVRALFAVTSHRLVVVVVA